MIAPIARPPAGPLSPPPGFDPSCKSGAFLEAYYCYNRFNATQVKHFCYDRDACSGPPQAWEIQRFRDSLHACMQVGLGWWLAGLLWPSKQRPRCLFLSPLPLTSLPCSRPHPTPPPIQLAVDRGHDISVNLHVDDATLGGLGGWRNTLNFDPTQPYSGVRWGSWAAVQGGARRLAGRLAHRPTPCHTPAATWMRC